MQVYSDKWNIPCENRHLVFLTPEGRKPKTLGKHIGKSINISWIDVANKIRKAAQSGKVYSPYIQRVAIDYTKQIVLHVNKLIKENDYEILT